MNTEYIQSCNCDYGCPCNFWAYPTKGHCEALVAYHVTNGKFGDTKLDGVTFAMGAYWPKAIHEGNGTARLYVDPKATAAQKAAIDAIGSGKNGGGVFEVFASTFTKVLPTKTAKIDWRFKGRDSSFSVEGVGEVKSSPIKNLADGSAVDAEIMLPKGINWLRADVTSVDWKLHDADFQMEHKNVAGFIATIQFTEKGPK